MSTTVQNELNGAPPTSARDRIASELELEIGALLKRERTLELELAEIKADRKTFEQSLLRLRGEPLIKHGGRGPYKTKKASDKPNGGISQELLDGVRAMVIEFARDHDEFRQVDIRTMPNAPTEKSSQTAVAFEQLRQAGVIRFARKDGNNKFYRLTPAGLRERDGAVDG